MKVQAETAVSEVGGDFVDQLEWAELRHLAAVGRNTIALAHDIRNELQVVAAALWLVHQQGDDQSSDLTQDALAAVERAADLIRRLGRVRGASAGS